MLILLFISIAVPFRLAFSESDDDLWIFLYAVMDVIFSIDIILTFFTSYTDGSHREITDLKNIRNAYLQSWFILDLISILPLDFLLKYDNFNTIFKFARIGKLYKLIRMTRLAKLFKLLKGNKTVLSRVTEKLQINSGKERLIFFSVFFFFFMHISACMYILLAGFEENERTNWLSPYLPMNSTD